jgi:amidase
METVTACEMARLIRDGHLSAREVVAAHLRRIESANPRVNAIVTLTAERAIADAQRADEMHARGEALGPLHGLPVVYKDLTETAGVRTTYGSPLFENYVPAEDAIVVERTRAAGAIMLGKTNTPEFGAGSQTFNRVFGVTRNPHDPTKTCGGSSGGAAVSLACGMTALADGTDVGGSLRNPAAFCGVVGLRPAPGRVPVAAAGNAWLTLGVSGPMARTAADVALYLSVLAGPDPRCVNSIDQPGSQFAGDLGRDFKNARVAWFTNLGGVPFDREVVDAVNAQRRIFQQLGCIVEEAEPNLDGAEEAFNTLRAWGFAAKYGDVLARNPDSVKETIRWEVERGLRLSGSDVARAETLHSQLWNRMRAFLETYEYFILPTAQVLPFDANEEYPREVAGVRMNSYIEWMKSCYFISILENPAISVPCGQGVGLQIVGRHRGEWSILQLAHGYEQARGWQPSCCAEAV